MQILDQLLYKFLRFTKLLSAVRSDLFALDVRQKELQWSLHTRY